MDTSLPCTLLATAILIVTFVVVGLIWKNGKKAGQIQRVPRD